MMGMDRGISEVFSTHGADKIEEGLKEMLSFAFVKASKALSLPPLALYF